MAWMYFLGRQACLVERHALQGEEFLDFAGLVETFGAPGFFLGALFFEEIPAVPGESEAGREVAPSRQVEQAGAVVLH